MNKLSALIKIVRPINFIITFLSVLVAGLICSATKEISFTIIIAALSAAFVSSSGNVINDYFDVEIDKINRPDRVLPSGLLTKSSAMIYYILLVLLSLVFALFVNSTAFIIALAAIISIFIYSLKFKSVPLAGNFIVAFFTGFTFIYGGVAVNNWEGGIFPAIFAFLINLMRELTKDIEDIKGDKAEGIRTFPIVFGIDKTKNIIIALSVLLIISTLFPFYLSIYNIEYLVLVLFTVDLLLVYLNKALLNAEKIEEFHRISSLMKLAMVLGLIAIYTGTL